MGFGGPGQHAERVFTGIFPNTRSNRWLHETLRTRAFLDHFGYGEGKVDPELWLSEGDHARAMSLLPGDGYLGLFVGAGSHLRQWPVAKWQRLARRAGYARIAVMGARTDLPVAERLVQGLQQDGTAYVNLAGKTSLRQLAACIQRCEAVVSNDSCGVHFAVAGGVPSVGILGGYHYGRYYPWGDPVRHRVAAAPMGCYYCNDACRYGDWRCVSDVSVDRVLFELRAALVGQRPEVQAGVI